MHLTKRFFFSSLKILNRSKDGSAHNFFSFLSVWTNLISAPQVFYCFPKNCIVHQFEKVFFKIILSVFSLIRIEINVCHQPGFVGILKCGGFGKFSFLATYIAASLCNEGRNASYFLKWEFQTSFHFLALCACIWRVAPLKIVDYERRVFRLARVCVRGLEDNNCDHHATVRDIPDKSYKVQPTLLSGYFCNIKMVFLLPSNQRMNPMGRGKLMTPPVQIIGIQVNKILDVWKGHNFGDRDNPPRNPSSKKLYMGQSVMRYNGTPVIFKAASKASPDDVK